MRAAVCLLLATLSAASLAQSAPGPDDASEDPIYQFHADTVRALLKSLSPAYPELAIHLAPTSKAVTSDPAHNDFVLRFVDEAQNAPAEQQPQLLLAADLAAETLWCPEELRMCEGLHQEFESHHLAFAYLELGGSWFYQHNLLWEVWQKYPTSDAGERAFVLLLTSGWDTSDACAKGSDQFRQVIAQADAFLAQHPQSPYRAEVTYLRAEAYWTWWTLAQTPTSGMADYVDPSSYRAGAAAARLRAIADFQVVERLAPGPELSKRALQGLEALRLQRVVSDGYRFFCVYD